MQCMYMFHDKVAVINTSIQRGSFLCLWPYYHVTVE